ncbi:hypothetical protein SBRCBS47491_008007 [Sporothrix bragantina]|uniref:NADP-dependent oxidoreductase domain-containing protein n=1 Tax=Sporothrix bragantina TaxID=671064 RepID=A0ABP0CHV7_9PEZI
MSGTNLLDTTMENMATTTRPLVLGDEGFKYQLHPNPESLPLRQILLRAFDLGVRIIDTSPYYEPSEQLIGAALAHPSVSTRYSRADWGFDLFMAAGVNTLFYSSPLAVGLLRNGSIPVGRTGDWHPAPPGLGASAQQAALWIEGKDETRKETLAGVALRYAVAKTMQNCRDGSTATTITGASSSRISNRMWQQRNRFFNCSRASLD